MPARFPTLVLLLIPGLVGCAIGSQESGRVIDLRNIAAIKVGQSTKQDILDLFGPPTSLSRVAGAADGAAAGGDGAGARTQEDVFTYEYRQENETFFTVLLYTSFHRATVADSLMVFFDDNDVVKYVAFAKQTEAEVDEEDEEPDEEEAKQ